MSLIALLLLAAPALHLEEAGEISHATAVELMAALGQRIERRIQGPVRIDAEPLECGTADRCVPTLSARLSTEDLVLIRVFGGATANHLVAERLRPLHPPLEAKADLPPDPALWGRALATLAETLFPERPAPMMPEPPPPPPPGSSRMLPLVLLGSSVACLGGGLAFGFAAIDTRRSLETTPVLLDDEQRALTAKLERQAVLTDVLIGLAVSAGMAALVTALWPADGTTP